METVVEQRLKKLELAETRDDDGWVVYKPGSKEQEKEPWHGYDEDLFPFYYNGVLSSWYKALDLTKPENMELITRYANYALDQYNEAQGSKLTVAKVIKANRAPIQGFCYYITFEVMSQSPPSGIQVYQAEVWDAYWGRSVPVCRPKPYYVVVPTPRYWSDANTEQVHPNMFNRLTCMAPPGVRWRLTSATPAPAPQQH